MHNIKENSDCTRIILAGNQCDNEYNRRVSKEEGTQFASEMGLPFYETSAKENTNIDELFDGVIDLVFDPDEKTDEITNEITDEKTDEITDEKTEEKTEEETEKKLKTACCPLL